MSVVSKNCYILILSLFLQLNLQVVVESIEFAMKFCFVINKLKINIFGKCICNENCVWPQKMRFCDEFNFSHRKRKYLAKKPPIVS